MIVKEISPKINITLETQEEIDKFYAIFNSSELNEVLDIDVHRTFDNPWRKLFLMLVEHHSEQGNTIFRNLLNMIGIR